MNACPVVDYVEASQKPFYSRVTPRAIAEGEWVPNAPIREAVRRAIGKGEVNWHELSVRLGWSREHGGYTHGDTSRLKRRLGIMPNTAARGYERYYSEYIRYELACAIIRALDLDPVDYGV